MVRKIFAVTVEHKPGVLQRVSSLFARRRFNIESITVGVTEDPKVARMVLVTSGDERVLEQIEKQLNKLIPVIKVSEIPQDSAVMRELALVKVHAPDERRKSQVIQYADVFRGRVVDVSPETISVEITGTSEKIDAFIQLVRGFGIKVVARTGITAIVRG